MIRRDTVEEAMFEALRMAATRLPPDVESALRSALRAEHGPLAREHLVATLDNADRAGNDGLVCGDTGYPLFFVRAGRDVQIEGGFATLWLAARDATRRATAQAFLRSTMVDPWSRVNPGTNCGDQMPKIELSFSEDTGPLEIVAAPKGGGSEIFGTFYRMFYPSDGHAAVKKFVVDSVVDGCYAGKICPPAIIGVGLGGTADLCMQLAKRAAVLRPVGSVHPDPRLAQLESDLMAGVRALGIGAMGAEGGSAVLAIHVATAMTHTAALPVAVNAQCMIGRRWRAVIEPDGTVRYSGETDGCW